MEEEKLKSLYDNISGEYELPDFNTFKSDMTDPAKLGRLHQTLTDDNYDVPDLDTFSADMFPEKKKPEAGQDGSGMDSGTASPVTPTDAQFPAPQTGGVASPATDFKITEAADGEESLRQLGMDEYKAKERSKSIADVSMKLTKLAEAKKLDATPWKMDIEKVLSDKSMATQEERDVKALRKAYQIFNDQGVSRSGAVDFPAVGNIAVPPTIVYEQLTADPTAYDMKETWNLLAKAEADWRANDPVGWNKDVESKKESHYSKLYNLDPRYTTVGDTRTKGLSTADKMLIGSALDDGTIDLGSVTVGTGQPMSMNAEAKFRLEAMNMAEKAELLAKEGKADEAKALTLQRGQAIAEADKFKAARQANLLKRKADLQAMLDKTNIPDFQRKAGMAALKEMEQEERGFLDPSYQFAKVFIENKDEITEASEPTDSPQVAMRKYLGNLLFEAKTLKDRIDSDETFMGGLQREASGLTTRGWNEDEQRLKAINDKIQSVSPVVLLNEMPEGDFKGGPVKMAGDFASSFANTMWGSSTMMRDLDTQTNVGKMADVNEMLLAVGADPEMIVSKPYKERFSQAQETGIGTFFTMEHGMELAGMIGAMAMQARVGGAAMQEIGVSKALGNLTAQVMAGTKGARFAKVAVGAMAKGMSYEITGDIFKDQDHFFNFTTGLAGGLSESATLGVLGAGKGVVKKMGRMIANAFGDKSDEAANWITAYGKTLRELADKAPGRLAHGVGGVTGQIAEGSVRALQEQGGSPDFQGFVTGLVDTFRGSNVHKSYWEGLKEQFGQDWSERGKFFLDMFFIGMGAGGGHEKGMGAEIMRDLERQYEEMTPEERAEVDPVIQSAGELEQVHDEVLEEMAANPDARSPEVEWAISPEEAPMLEVNAVPVERSVEVAAPTESVGREPAAEVVPETQVEGPVSEPTQRKPIGETLAGQGVMLDMEGLGRLSEELEIPPKIYDTQGREIPASDPRHKKAMETMQSWAKEEAAARESAKPTQEAKPMPVAGDSVDFMQGPSGKQTQRSGKVLEVLPSGNYRMEFEVGGEKTTAIVKPENLVGDYSPESKAPEPVVPVVPPQTPPLDPPSGGIPPTPPTHPPVEPPSVPPVTPPSTPLSTAAGEGGGGQKVRGRIRTLTDYVNQGIDNSPSLKRVVESVGKYYSTATHSETYRDALKSLGFKVEKSGKVSIPEGVDPLKKFDDLTDRNKKFGIDKFAEVLAQRQTLQKFLQQSMDAMALEREKETDPDKIADLDEAMADAYLKANKLMDVIASQGTIGGQGISFFGAWRNMYEHPDGVIRGFVNDYNKRRAEDPKVKKKSQEVASDLNDIREQVGNDIANSVPLPEAKPEAGKPTTKDTIAKERKKREASVSKLRDLLKGPDMGQMRDVTTLAAELIGRGGEAALELTKIGVSLAKEGAVRFVDWAKRMREELKDVVEFTDEDLKKVFESTDERGMSPREHSEIALAKAALEPAPKAAREKTLRESIQKELKSGDPADLKKRLIDNAGLTEAEADLVMEKGATTIEKRAQRIAEARDKAEQQRMDREQSDLERKAAATVNKKVKDAMREHFSKDTMANVIAKAMGIDAATTPEAKEAIMDEAKALRKKMPRMMTPERILEKVMEETGLEEKEARKIAEAIAKENAMTLFDRVKEKTGLPDDQVQEIVDKAKDEFDKRAKARVEARVKAMKGGKKKPSGEPKTDAARALDALLDGELDTDMINDIFKERLGFGAHLSADQMLKARKLATALAQSKKGTILELDAARRMDRFLDEFLPQDKGFKGAMEVWKALSYASMLSGIATSAKNVASAATIVMLQPAYNMANFSEWARSLRILAKTGDMKAFARSTPFAAAVVKYRGLAQGISQARRLGADVWLDGYIDAKYLEAGKTMLGRQMNVIERRDFETGRDLYHQWRDSKGFKEKALALEKTVKWIYKFSGRNLQMQDVFLRTMAYEAQIADAIRMTDIGKTKAEMEAAGFKGSYLGWAKFQMSLKNPVMADAVRSATADVEAHEQQVGKMTDAQRKRMIEIRTREYVHENLAVSQKSMEDADAIARSQIFTHQRHGVHSAWAGLMRKMSGNQIAGPLLWPIIPFTTIIGNLSDTMNDFSPITGIARANGISTSEALQAFVRNKSKVDHGPQSARMADRVEGQSYIESVLNQNKDSKYYEQMGRAWFGLQSLVAATMMVSSNPYQGFGLTADDDDENPHMIMWNGEPIISYKDLPVIGPAAAMVAYWQSYARRFPEDKDDIAGRAFYAFYGAETLPGKVSVAESSINLLELVTKGIGLYIGNQDPDKDVEPGAQFADVMEALTKPYLQAYTKPLPWRTSIVEQTAQIFDQNKYSKRDIKQSLEYAFTGAAYRFMGEAKQVDIFGDELEYLPGEDAFGFLNFFTDDVSEREHVKFLNERGITFGPTQNREVAWNDPTAILGIEFRNYNTEEFDYFVRESGKLFKQAVIDIMADPEAVAEADKELVTEGNKKMTLTEKTVRDALSDARSTARQMVQEKFSTYQTE